MSPDDAVLLDMLRAGRLATEFVAEVNKDEFLIDLKSQSAAVHQLLVLGEAAKRISAACRSSHPEIPWRSVAGMRDKLIHHYDAVDLDEVWKTLRSDVPALLMLLERLTQESGGR